MSNENIIEISENELSQVAGGVGNPSKIPFACRKSGCGEIFYIKAGESVAVCPKCKARYEIKG